MSIDAIISFLSNKKTTIATIISAVLVWALGRGYVAQDTAGLISVIMVALGFTSNVVTAQYYKKKDKQDEYVAKANIDVAVSEAETGKNPVEPATPSF